MVLLTRRRDGVPRASPVTAGVDRNPYPMCTHLHRGVSRPAGRRGLSDWLLGDGPRPYRRRLSAADAVEVFEGQLVEPLEAHAASGRLVGVERLRAQRFETL